MIRNFKFSFVKNIFKRDILNFKRINFSDHVKEVFGLSKPLLVKSNPRNQMFYGIKLFKLIFLLGSPMSKAIPKTKEDFVERLKYLNNTNDMIEIFIQCKDVYGGEEIGKFLEKYNS